MALFVSSLCPNKKCSSHVKDSFYWKDIATHEVIGRKGEEQTMQCQTCKHTWKREAPRTMKRSVRYPYFNSYLGKKVDTPSHEEAVAKSMDLVKE